MTTEPSPADEVMLRYLATHDACCPQCGYELRSSSSSACPECGAELRLTLDGGPTFSIPWLALIIGLALFAGNGIHRWIIESQHGFPNFWRVLQFEPNVHVSAWRVVVHFFVLASPILLVAVVCARRWIMRQHWMTPVAAAITVFAVQAVEWLRIILY